MNTPIRTARVLHDPSFLKKEFSDYPYSDWMGPARPILLKKEFSGHSHHYDYFQGWVFQELDPEPLAVLLFLWTSLFIVSFDAINVYYLQFYLFLFVFLLNCCVFILYVLIHN